MSAQTKNACPKTFSDWFGELCFLGCLLATVGLSCFGISNILKKGLHLEAIDALLSMLKLLGLNCGLMLVAWAASYIFSEIMLGIIVGAQAFIIPVSGLFLDLEDLPDKHLSEDPNFFICFSRVFFLVFLIRSIVMFAIAAAACPMPFLRRAVSKRVTVPLLVSYVLSALLIATAALGTFGILIGPASILDKLAASVVACGTILTLAVVARLLRVLHASKIVHSTGLLGSFPSSDLMAFVISHHLGSTFLYYARLCIPLMAAAVICISIEGWPSIISQTNPLITVAILLFPTYDTVCGARMLILKESIWDERITLSKPWAYIPACSIIIILLQDTNFTISFGTLIFAHIFELKLFGNTRVLNPYSILTCTAIYLANNLLFANMIAESPAQIGIYLNAPHAADLAEIPESEFKAATRLL